MVARRPVIVGGRVIAQGGELPQGVDSARLVERGLACAADGQCPGCDCKHGRPKRSPRKR